MALPTTNDFNKWSGTAQKFDNTMWDGNIDKTVEILSNGTYDLNINQLTANELPAKAFKTLYAGENITAGDVVRVSSNQVYKATNASEAGITSIVGICSETVTSGNIVKITNDYYDAYTGLTAGTIYYVGLNGGITSTLPTTYQHTIGIAVSSTRLNIDDKNATSPTDIIIESATPKLTLRDTNGGSNEEQEINFETADGQYAKIEGASIGTAIGELNFNTKQSGDATPVERLTIDSKTRIKTQHITTNTGGILTWSNIELDTNEAVILITSGHFSGVLYVHGYIASTNTDYSARYGLAWDSWAPYVSISQLSAGLATSSLSVFTADAYLYIKNLGSFRLFDFTVIYNGDTSLAYIENPVPF